MMFMIFDGNLNSPVFVASTFAVERELKRCKMVVFINNYGGVVDDDRVDADNVDVDNDDVDDDVDNDEVDVEY